MKNKPYPLYKTEQINSLKELINYTSEAYGDEPAFIFERKGKISQITYKQFKNDIEAFAAALFDMGIKKEKVGVIGENSYEWILAFFAVVNNGNIAVPIDRELPKEDIMNIVLDSDTAVFVYANTYTDVADFLKENSDTVKHYIDIDYFPEIIKSGNNLIQKDRENVYEYVIENKALAAILYTSGTTGRSKGVMLSHYAIARDTVAACQHVGIFGSNMLVLPLHHSFSFTAAVAAMLLKGSPIYINKSLKNVLSDLGTFKPHNMFLVPLFVETFYKKIWEGAKKQGKDDLLKKLIAVSNVFQKAGIDLRRVIFKSVLKSFGGNLNLIVSGGAPIDAKYVQGLRDFGINVLNGYGITECSPVVSVNRNQHYRDGSVGRVLPACEVKIANPNEIGHGEICVQGEITMLGYYKNKQATKETFDGEWFKTGDIGYIDDDGFLYITGRKKNLIVLSNGKNVYPEELEFELTNHIPYIKEAVVFSEGDKIIAEVFLDVESDPGCAAMFDDDVAKFNKTQAIFKNINKTIIRDSEFPKTTTKKIKRQYS